MMKIFYDIGFDLDYEYYRETYIQRRTLLLKLDSVAKQELSKMDMLLLISKGLKNEAVNEILDVF